MNPYNSQPQAHPSSQGINPSLIGSYQGGNLPQNKFNTGPPNVGHMMNGGMNMGMGQSGMGNMNMGMGMNQMTGINNPQLHQQHHPSQQQHHPQQRAMMNGMNPMMNSGGMNPMMPNQMNLGGMSNSGINPNALASPTSPANQMHSSMNMMNMGNMGMGPMPTPLSNMMNSSNPMMSSNGSASPHNMPHPNATSLSSPMGHAQMNGMMGGQMPQGMGMGGIQQNMSALLNRMGISREQFQHMSPQEQQNITQRMMQMMQQAQHHQQQQQHSPPLPHQQPMYDRPPSSSSMRPTMPNQPHMMPPPPRPTTAQSNASASGISRPGTAMGVRTRAAAAAASAGSPSASNSHQPRPSSRAGTENGMMGGQMANGYQNAHGNMPKAPSTPQMPHQMSHGGPSISPPGSPSPFRQSPNTHGMNPLKRKMSEPAMNAPSPMGGPMNMSMPPSGGAMPQQGMPMHNMNGFAPTSALAELPRPMSAAGVGPVVGGMGMGPAGSPIHGGPMTNMNMGGPMPGNMMGMPGMGTQHGRHTSTPFMGNQPPHPGLPHEIPSSRKAPPLPNGIPSQPGVMPMSQAGGISRMPSVAASVASAASGSGALASSLSNGSIAAPAALPPGINANLTTTRVSVIPLVGSDKAIPQLTEEEITNIQGWIKTDQEYEGIYRTMKDKMMKEVKSDIGGAANIKWWDKGTLSGNPNSGLRRRTEQFDVRYPRSRRERDPGRARKSKQREGLRIPRHLKPEDANRPEQLVPIRLEFDYESHKMRDAFVWNLNDPIVTVEHFAQTVVEDYNLPPTYHAVISKSIHEQLSDFKAHSASYDPDGGEQYITAELIQTGSLDDKSAAWWESWRNRLRTEYGSSRSGKRKASAGRQSRLLSRDQLDDHYYKSDHNDETQDEQDDTRILIRLDITVGSVKLEDQLEWDLDNPTASPEEFAMVYSQDLGLGGEFLTAISHSIREQIQTYQKSLFLVGGQPADGSGVQDDELRSSFLPPLSSGARPIDQVSSFTPLLNYLSDGELERNEKERDKDMTRRRKRNTRGRRGIALPDREPIRTCRTPAIGFPELDAATLALAAAANAPVSRRAAAAAASLTIANMVASENGTPFLPQSMPSAPQPPPPTIAKPRRHVKGLFKPPRVPSKVLRARAHVPAPTTSTAADISSLPAPLENDPPPSTSTHAENRSSRLVTARRAKEIEREAKEKEFADGQHSNYIDGVWHCSNCGCPESIAIGRRKGPLGDKSQCGTCGKYWHRHRRPRPVDYNMDPAFHSNAKREMEIAKSVAKKKGGAAALRAQSATGANTPADGPSTPSRKLDIDSSRHSPTFPPDDDRAMSPVSTVSSASEPPLAQKVKMNGSHSQAPSASAVTSNGHNSPRQGARDAIPDQPTSPTRTWPPQWLAASIQATQIKYPNDKFDVSLRKVNSADGTGVTSEWRIKCVDCPGKLYKPGPGETLSNFEVHLKNRKHRQRVDDRVGDA